MHHVALVGWLSWLEHHPVHQKIAGSIPGQGTDLGCGLNPLSGCIQEAAKPCFSFSSFLYKSINIFSDEDLKSALFSLYG